MGSSGWYIIPIPAILYNRMLARRLSPTCVLDSDGGRWEQRGSSLVTTCRLQAGDKAVTRSRPTPDQISFVEHLVGTKLPSSYIALLMFSTGGHLEGDSAPLGGQGRAEPAHSSSSYRMGGARRHGRLAQRAAVGQTTSTATIGTGQCPSSISNK